MAEQRRNIVDMSRPDGRASTRVWSPNRGMQTSTAGFMTDPLSGHRLVDPVHKVR